jgi:predicted small lipoprotein YifL
MPLRRAGTKTLPYLEVPEQSQLFFPMGLAIRIRVALPRTRESRVCRASFFEWSPWLVSAGSHQPKVGGHLEWPGGSRLARGKLLGWCRLTRLVQAVTVLALAACGHQGRLHITPATLHPLTPDTDRTPTSYRRPQRDHGLPSLYHLPKIPIIRRRRSLSPGY